MWFWLIIGGLILLGWISSLYAKAKLYDSAKPRIDQIDKIEREQKVTAKLQQQKEEAIAILSKQKSVGFPWLAHAYAEYHELEELKKAAALERKSHPAYKAAEEVRGSAKRRREAEKEARMLRYQIEYYETLFPWLTDLKSEEIEEELIRIRSGKSEDQDSDDPAKRWLTPEEYNRLPDTKKYELALERYWTKKKTRWEIGRDYERFIGYKYEATGFRVIYQGIVEGFDDLGRDLICEKNTKVFIVQCKYWSQEKQIHEKHVFQLFGTMIAYRHDNPGKNVDGHFVTSTRLSDRARAFAKDLGIKISENTSLEKYPCIKCNIAKRDGEKIYHLPFDQQYDRTTIISDSGEFYASTIEEAEKKGFRRAFRYRGPMSRA
ncbi:MAG TPA: restriction endonuclease [Opitutaceae bacterium]|nr:restriction endonuclease [Opitutaceae bacterium]